MLTYGLAITQADDPLQKTDVAAIVRKIINPKPGFTARIEQLRQIRVLDEKQYSRLKTQLPYFCCGIFHPLFRKKKNFASISCFTLDFDHFSDEHFSREEAFNKMKADERVRFIFTTPGGDGLKALFVLDKPCTDAGLYSHFYKTFARHFVQKHGLEKVIDWVTHDVTRATFFSADPGAWDNPIPVAVKMTDYISAESTMNFGKIEKEFNQMAKAYTGTLPQKEELNQDVLSQIKIRLNPDYKPKREKNVFVPEELKEAIPVIEKALKKENMTIAGMKSIYYGKQLKITMAPYWAEVNIFYGQKGFSIVKTTKTGSNSDLAELAYQIIDRLLN